jgi:hypothetical protein
LVNPKQSTGRPAGSLVHSDKPLAGRSIWRSLLFFRPFGADSLPNFHPRLAAWAAFFRRFAAKARGDTAKARADTAKVRSDTAKVRSDTAKARGDTAKARGDTARGCSDTAKARGDTAKARGDTAKASGDTAKTRGNRRLRFVKLPLGFWRVVKIRSILALCPASNNLTSASAWRALTRR